MPAEILNPVRYREDFLKEHASGTETYLNELLEKTGTSLKENQSACQEINALDKVLLKTKRKFSLFKTGMGILLTLLVILVLTAIGGAYYVFTEPGISLSPAAVYSIFVSCILVAVGFLVLIILTSIFLSKKNKKFKATISNFEEVIGAKTEETISKLYEFYRAFNYSQVYSQTQAQIPEIEFLKSADTNFVKYIEKNFDPVYAPSSTSMLVDYRAGYFYKNPFIVGMYKEMNLVPHTYTGSLAISYYSGFGEHRRLVSETLHATLVKPKPEYKYIAVNSLYANAVPELEFEKAPVLDYNPAKHDKYIKQAEKTLAQIEKKNADFTPMSNTEFEAMFPATKRSSEQKYRAFFGQVAQQNLINFAKTLPSGRNYTYSKSHNTNEVTLRELSESFDINPLEFVGYNLTIFLNKYKEYAKVLSASLYDSFVPYLSNPVLLEGNISKQPEHSRLPSVLEHLALLAKLKSTELLPDEAGIDEYILEPLSEYDSVCKVHSFKAVPRVEYVVVNAGDGPHQVPVNWIEYIPVFKELRYKVTPNQVDANYFENNFFDKNNQAYSEENTVSIVK